MPLKVKDNSIYHILLVLYCLLIFILSSIPGDELPKVDFEFSDKFVHLIEYAVLCYLFFYSLKNQSKYVKLQNYALEFAVLFTSLYGITDEIHQYFVLNRSCEFADWVADTLGAVLMYVFLKYILRVNKAKIFAVLFLFILFTGCSGNDEYMTKEKPVITIEMAEAWLDFMPVVTDDDKNRFGFLLDLKFEGKNLDTNYVLKAFEVKLNNDILSGKKFNVRFKNFSDTAFNMEIYQQYDEKYLDKEKKYPEDVIFTFDINKNNKLVRKITTPKIKILKTQ